MFGWVYSQEEWMDDLDRIRRIYCGGYLRECIHYYREHRGFEINLSEESFAFSAHTLRFELLQSASRIIACLRDAERLISC